MTYRKLKMKNNFLYKWELLTQELQQNFTRANIKFARQYIDKIFASYIEEGKVLDIGCGEGPKEVDLLLDKGYEITGITMQQWMADENPNIQIMDMHDLQFKSESFDAAYSCMVMEHSYAPWLAIAEIWTVLKPDGIFLMLVPPINRPSIVSHPTMLSFERWKFIFKQIGFEVINEEHKFISEGRNDAILYLVGQKVNAQPDKRMQNFIAKLKECHAKTSNNT